MSRVRVLVVDDSAFARKVVRESLQTSSQIEVIGTARDGIDALEKIATLKPDVITLDLVMPNLDGLGVLATLTPAQRARVVVVSMADGDSDIGVAALGFGVFDLVHKPTALAVASLHEIADELVTKVLLASAHALGSMPPSEPHPPSAPVVTRATSDRIVLIGTSTGGPQALTRLLKEVPAHFPAAIAMVLHIPYGYTGPLAQRLNEESALEVLEAEEGLELQPGRAILARAGVHMKLDCTSTSGVVRAKLDAEPRAAMHRPSVNALCARAAALGRRALGVVLTGMGDDGLLGARAIHDAGGQILTETEASCVVYGMPRVVKEAGLADGEAPLQTMIAAISARL